MVDSRHRSTAPPTPSFAATPAEFHLFQKSERGVKRPRGFTQPLDPFSLDFSAESSDLTALTHLRSNAFWELHRAVAENGEGFIKRMRDYELLRSKSDAYLRAKRNERRGRKRSSLACVPRKTLSLHRQPAGDTDDVDDDDDDDDVQILLQPLSQRSYHKKRAASLDSVDEGLNQDNSSSPSTRSGRCSSPSPESSFMCHSDDELHISGVPRPLFPSPSHRFSPSSTPALSHTLSNSANSSLVSLALLSPTQSTLNPSRPVLSSSRSEKAIAALSLAFANGAGGLTDYEALLAIQATPALDNGQVGEMWQ